MRKMHWGDREEDGDSAKLGFNAIGMNLMIRLDASFINEPYMQSVERL